MPLRADPSLWFNLPGVVAAYQPVRAPDSLLARYNMAHGGDNRYRAELGVLPAWGRAMGWTFNGTSQYLTTGVMLAHPAALFVRFSGATGNEARVLMGAQEIGPRVRLEPNYSGHRYYEYGNTYTEIGPGSAITSGVMAVIGGASSYQGYLNGAPDGTAGGGLLTLPAISVYIGALNTSGTPSLYWAGNIQAVLICIRAISRAEAWHVSRQMAYCDVNPDWSVWAPRRKWFPYVLQVAGHAGIYGARPTVALPGGVRIVPQDEGGVNG